MARRRHRVATLGGGAESDAPTQARSGGAERPAVARARCGRAPNILPETRRNTIPGARRRTSLCADGLGKDARRAATPSVERIALDASCQPGAAVPDAACRSAAARRVAQALAHAHAHAHAHATASAGPGAGAGADESGWQVRRSGGCGAKVLPGTVGAQGRAPTSRREAISGVSREAPSRRTRPNGASARHGARRGGRAGRASSVAGLRVVKRLCVALAAGEASGDTLGAGLIEAIKARVPDARFVGIAGPKMIAAGCEPWFRAEELSVMGFAEVLPHLPRLLRIRRELRERIKSAARGRVRRHRRAGFQFARVALAEGGRNSGRSVCKPADLGVAPGPGEDDPRVRRSRALRAAVREEVLRGASASTPSSSAIRSRTLSRSK